MTRGNNRVARIANRGDWIQTYTGKKFHPLDPQPEDICIEDIAHALSMNCRFAGHCLKFYSVAEHSINVSKHVKLYLRLEALLHDAAEAYIQDIPRPIKPMLTNYKEIERGIEKAIALKFNIGYPLNADVKDIDNRILSDEKNLLMSSEPSPWTLYGEPLGFEYFHCWEPKLAEGAFIQRYYDLVNL